MSQPRLQFEHFEVLTDDLGAPLVLGRGGMGTTYRAFDTRLRRSVVLKLINEQMLLDPSTRLRFINEARAAALIDHPNVARVLYLSPEDAEQCFFAMEFVDGESLASLVERNGPLPRGEALRLLRPVVEALTALAGQNLIHRDIKPDNIMIAKAGGSASRVKLIDFGLAKSLGAAHERLASVNTGDRFVGSAYFASPEQILSHDLLDARSDFYSLGATLWQVLTGYPPFAGTVFQVLEAHVYHEPPWPKIAAAPRPICALLTRLLAKHREERPADAATLLAEWDEAIRQLEDDPTGAVRPLAADESTEPMVDEFAVTRADLADPEPILATVPRERRDREGATGDILILRPSPRSPIQQVEVAALAQPTEPPAIREAKPPRKLVRGGIGAVALLALALGGLLISHAGTNKRRLPSSAAVSTSPEQATKANPWKNSLGLEFVPIPGTKILMCRTDTRVEDFRRFAETANYRIAPGIFVTKATKEADGRYSTIRELDPNASWKQPGFEQTSGHPVVGVSREDATRFCYWLSKTEGRTYRLPTDAEWSAAVGPTKYPWGYGWPPPIGVGNYGDDSFVRTLPKGYKWSQVPGDDGYPETSPVGRFPPNRYGLFDLGGNVWQWCEDQYQASLNDADVLAADPTLETERMPHGASLYVLRGASWYDRGEIFLRSSCRYRYDPTARADFIGFRCVLALPGG